MSLRSLLTSVFFAGWCTASWAQAIIEPSGQVELIKGNFQFTEGPAAASDSSVYFSDIPAETIHRLDADGSISVFTDASKHTNGMIFTSDGRLLGCQMDGAVVQYDLATGKVLKVLADSFEGKRFNAPNDLIIDKVGGIYFTDPLYRAPDPLPQEIQAVYYISASGDVSRVTEPIAAPNGIALSPDASKLYVIPSMQAKMLVFDVLSPGKLSKPETLCTVRQPEGQTMTGGDGMVVDESGNLYITTHLGVQIFSDAGAAIGYVEIPEQPANVTFGGADRKTMYVTARTGIYKVPMPIAGLAPN